MELLELVLGLFVQRTEGDESIAAVFGKCLFQTGELIQSRGRGLRRVGILIKGDAAAVAFGEQLLDEAGKGGGVSTAGEPPYCHGDRSAGQMTAIGVGDEKPYFVPDFQNSEVAEGRYCGGDGFTAEAEFRTQGGISRKTVSMFEIVIVYISDKRIPGTFHPAG